MAHAVYQYNHSELFVSTADGERALCHGSERGPPLSLNHYATGTLQNCLAKGARQWGTAKGELTGHHARTDGRKLPKLSQGRDEKAGQRLDRCEARQRHPAESQQAVPYGVKPVETSRKRCRAGQ